MKIKISLAVLLFLGLCSAASTHDASALAKHVLFEGGGLSQPSPKDEALRLNLKLEIINLRNSQQVTLFGGPSNQVPLAVGICSSGNTTPDWCSVNLTIPETQFQNVTDQMILLLGKPCDENGLASGASLRGSKSFLHAAPGRRLRQSDSTYMRRQRV
jgi:hypothetical protein